MKRRAGTVNCVLQAQQQLTAVILPALQARSRPSTCGVHVRRAGEHRRALTIMLVEGRDVHAGAQGRGRVL